jgi:hypothetical protein
LKRLVPQAAKRELSEKLEKADILQMALDYLKTTGWFLFTSCTHVYY